MLRVVDTQQTLTRSKPTPIKFEKRNSKIRRMFQICSKLTIKTPGSILLTLNIIN